MSLTGIEDTDLIIVQFMDSYDIINLAQVSEYWSELCNDCLWQNIISRDFQISHFIGNPREQYRYLSGVSLRRALDDGRIDGLELFHRKDPVSTFEAVETIRRGHDEMFWWIIDQGVEPDDECINEAISHGCEEIFDRLWTLGLRPGSEIHPGGLWMILKMIDLGYTPEEKWADWALFSDDLRSLEFLYHRGISPSPYAFEICCQFECLDLLEWAENHGITLTVNCMNEALIYGQIEMIKWFYERGIVPSDNTRPSICRGDLNALTWLEEHNLGRFDSGHSDWALEEGLLHLVEWFLDREIEPTIDGLKWAAPEAQVWVAHYKKMKQA